MLEDLDPAETRAWSEDDRDRLAAALWRFIHPDLAHGPADPYTDPDDG